MVSFLETFGGMALGCLGAGFRVVWRVSAAPREQAWPVRPVRPSELGNSAKSSYAGHPGQEFTDS